MNTKPTPGMSEYARGLFDALRIAKEVQAEMEAPLRRVRDDVGSAYLALNAATHWSQSVISAAETRILHVALTHERGGK